MHSMMQVGEKISDDYNATATFKGENYSLVTSINYKKDLQNISSSLMKKILPSFFLGAKIDWNIKPKKNKQKSCLFD